MKLSINPLRDKTSSRRRRNQPKLGIENLEPRVVLDGRLVISEFVADNDNTLLDEDGDDPDWVEIFNAGTSAVNVEGWHLTDDPDDLNKSELGPREILPGQYLIVFASGKDRDDPLIGNLHTNFQLDPDGEYLALTRPDQSIAFEFAPTYPPQIEDVAYGIPSTVTQTTLLSAGASAKLHVPTDGSIDPDLDNEIIEGSWVDPAFDDGAWSDATVGIGYWDESNDPNPKPGDGTVIADSVAEFSGTQGDDNWRYGSYAVSLDADGIYDPNTTDFRQFINLPNIAFLNNWNVDEEKWDLSVKTTNPQNTELRDDGAIPAGTDTSSEVHHPVRRWESEITGGLLIHGTIDNPDPSGDGIIARILIDGEEVYSREVNGGSAEYAIIRQVQEDQKIDFMLDAGPAGSAAGDNTLWDVTIEDVTPIVGDMDGVPTLTPEIETDIEDQMKGIGSSAYVRIPFTTDVADFDSLSLLVKYQDGFIAYLNGQEIARSPSAGEANATWQSVADSEKTVPEALQFESFNVTPGLDLLSAGTTNVLMFQALNVSDVDDDLLLVPELIGTTLTVDEADRRYFPTVTPGEQNGVGIEELGPLFRNNTHTPNVPVTSDSIVVTTEISETFHPIAPNVTLNYRVMYGDTTQMPMVDDGTGGDAVAGDGIYSATIPGNIGQSGEMVRWFMTGADTTGNESRFPLFIDEGPGDQVEEYFGTIYLNSPIDSNLPVIHTFFENPSRANNDTGTFGSFFFNGEFYDNVNMNLHGQSSRSFPKRSYDVFLPEDHRFELSDDVPRVSKFNLLSNYADKSKLRNSLAWETRRLTGAAHHLAFPVRIEQNGSFFAVYDYVEDADARWLERLGLDPKNQLWKSYNTFNTASGAEKKTAKDTGNEDMAAFIEGLNQPLPGQRDFIYDNVNLAGMANFLAGFVLTADTDCCHKNYYVYHDSSGSGEWWYFDWDVDLTYGRNWGGFGLSYHDYTIYHRQGLRLGTNNHFISKLYAIPEFAQMYNRRIRTIMDDVFGGPGEGNDTIENKIQQLVDDIGADGPADHDKWGQVSSNHQAQPFRTWPQAVDEITDEYLNPRREYLETISAIPDSQPADTVIEIAAVDFNPDSGNQDEEYIQLTNNNDYAVDITDWELTNGVRMTFQAGTVIPSGGSLYVTPDARAFRARTTGPSGGQQLFVQGGYRGHLSNFGETVELVRRDGTLANTFTYIGDPSPAQQYLRITEVMYNPLGPSADELAIDDFENDDFEYTELTNISTTETLDLTNVRFTSGFQFNFTGSDVTSLAPGERVLVVKDRAAFNARYGNGMDAIIAGTFADGSLNNGGEPVKLEDATNSTVLEFRYEDDTDRGWPSRADGRGSSLQIIDPTSDYEEGSNWRPSVEINGSPGIAGGAAEVGVVINEVLTNSEPPSLDSIELVNISAVSISLENYYLSDSAATVETLQHFAVPAGELGPGQYIVFDESDFNPSGGVDPGDFALSSLGDQVYLTVGDATGPTHFADFVEFGAIATGESYGRFPNGTGPLVPMTQNTFNDANSSPRIGPAIISELQYNPGEPTPEDLAIAPNLDEGDLEYVEIHNSSNSPISLTDWRIRGGVDLNFDEGLMLDAGETVVVISFNPDNPFNVDRVAAFRSHYSIDASVRLIGGYAGQLDDGGERVTLQRPDTPVGEPQITPRLLEDEVRYSDSAPWTPDADGTGMSLTRISTTGLGNESTSWRAATPTPGTAEFTDIPGDTNQDGIVDSTDIDALFNAINTNDNSDVFDVDNSGEVNSDDVTHLVENILGTFMGDTNLDGAIDVTDLNQVGIHWQQLSGATWATGDLTGDGAVTAADLGLIGLNWQRGIGLGAAARTPRAALAASAIPPIAELELVDRTLELAESQSRPLDAEAGIPVGEDSTLPRRVLRSRYARRHSANLESPNHAEADFASLADDAFADWNLL